MPGLENGSANALYHEAAAEGRYDYDSISSAGLDAMVAISQSRPSSAIERRPRRETEVLEDWLARQGQVWSVRKADPSHQIPF